MNKYTVIETFTDLQDNNHRYLPGDNFPREGLKVSEARLKELSTDKNRRQRPMIKEEVVAVKESVVAEEVKKPTTKKGKKKADAK